VPLGPFQNHNFFPHDSLVLLSAFIHDDHPRWSGFPYRGS
jgi:hypothetical protein